MLKETMLKTYSKALIAIAVTVLVFAVPVSFAKADTVWTTIIGGYAYNGHEQVEEATNINNALNSYGVNGGVLLGASSGRLSYYRFSATNEAYFTLNGSQIGSSMTIVHKQDWIGIANNNCAGFVTSYDGDGNPYVDFSDSDCNYVAIWGRGDAILGIYLIPPPPLPTASITITDNTAVSGASHNLSVPVGHSYSWNWSSSNGTVFSTYLTSNNNVVCGNGPWGVDTSVGTITGIVPASVAGCSWKIVYTVSGPGGTVTDTVYANVPLPVYTIVASAGIGGSISPSGQVSVDSGVNKTFSITPTDSNFQISSVTVDGVNQGAISSYTFSNVSADHTIRAEFYFSPPPINYSLTASSGANGSISPSGLLLIPRGNNQTFSFIPNSGYSISSVTVDGVNLPSPIPSSYTFQSITADHTISVVFTPIVRTINASAGVNGSISPSGSVLVNQGTNKTFIITPNSGYDVASVLVDGVNQGAISSYTFTSVTSSHTISATFSVTPYTPPPTLSDITPPSNPIASSPTHTAGIISTVTSGTFNWTSVTDTGVSGLAGYSFVIDNSVATIPDGVVDTASTSTVQALSFGNVYYFHVKALDNAGNFSATSHIGPFIISNSQVSINNSTINGVSYTVFSPSIASSTSFGVTGLSNVSGSSITGGSVASSTISLSTTTNATIASSTIISSTINGGTITNSTVTGSTLNNAILNGSTLSNVTVLGTGSTIINSTLASTTVTNAVIINGVIYSGSMVLPNGTTLVITVPTALTSLVNYAPLAAFSASSTGGLNISITDSSSDANSGTAFPDSWSYSWNFGDGVVSTTSTAAIGNNRLHTYSAAGNYTITLNLTDQYGLTSVATSSITVSSPPPPPSTFTINATAGLNGTTTPSGVTTLASGANQIYTITPNVGYNIATLTVDGVSIATSTSYTFTNVTANHTIGATFSLIPGTPTFNITASSGGGGTTTPSGVTAVVSGTNQTYNIIPNTGFNIATLIVDGVSIATSTSYTFTNVTANHTIGATFTLIPGTPTFTITAGAGLNGTTTPSGTTTVVSGTNQTYSITPNAGYQIASLTIDGASVATSTSYTFTNVIANHTISSTFSPVPFTPTFDIAGIAIGGGSISPSATSTLSQGSNVTFTLTPNVGFILNTLTSNGAPFATTTATSAILSNLSATTTVVATFGLIPGVDLVPPTTPANLTSSHATSTINTSTTVNMSWSASTDIGGSGLAGYSFVLDTASTTIPDNTVDLVSTSIMQTPGYGTFYFHIKALDGAGNASATVHYGPIIISDSNVLIINSTIGGTYYAFYSPTLAQATLASTTGNTTIVNSNISVWWNILNSSLNAVTFINSDIGGVSATSSTISNSILSNCTIINATVKNYSGSNCSIANSIVDPPGGTNNLTGSVIDSSSQIYSSDFTFSTSTSSYVATSTVSNSILINSTSTSSTIDTSTLNGSTVSNSFVTGSTIATSTLSSSTSTNSIISNSSLTGATSTDSAVLGSNVSGSVLTDATSTNSTILNSTLTNSTSTGSVINSSILTNDIVASSSVANSTITNSALSVVTSTSSNISGSNITSSVLTDSLSASSTITSSTLTNATSTNSTISSSDLTNSTSTGSVIGNSTLLNDTVTNSSVTGSTVSNSVLTAATSTGSLITNSTLTSATSTNSSITGIIVSSSLLNSSTSTNSVISGSVLNNSTSTSSNISGSTVTNSVLTNATSTGSVILSSTLNNATSTNSNILNSSTSTSTLSSSTSTGSVISGSTLTNSTSTSSFIATSTITNSSLQNATSTGSNLLGSLIISGTTTNSIFTNSTSTGSNIASSTLTNSTSTSSTINNSTLTGSNISTSTLNNVSGTGSTVTNSSLASTTLTNAVISGGVISSGTITLPSGTPVIVSTLSPLTSFVNYAPTALFSALASNLSAAITDLSSDPNSGGSIGDSYTYNWNFGDGVTVTSNTPTIGNNQSHSYSGAGTYNILLTLTDAFNLSSVFSSPVTVTAPAPVITSGGGGGGSLAVSGNGPIFGSPYSFYRPTTSVSGSTLSSTTIFVLPPKPAVVLEKVTTTTLSKNVPVKKITKEEKLRSESTKLTFKASSTVLKITQTASVINASTEAKSLFERIKEFVIRIYRSVVK